MTGQKTYGVYFIPPPELAYKIGLTHVLLKQNYGLEAAGKFMPHCTLFALLHLEDGFGENELIAVLDRILPSHTAFPLVFKLETEYFIRLELEKQPALENLQANICEELWSYLSEYGRKRRASTRYNPHITLAFSDLPADTELLHQIEAFCLELYRTMPREILWGNIVQLVEFTLQSPGDWDAPDYWRYMNWRIIKSYTLAAK
jgi:hypothetical protein